MKSQVIDLIDQALFECAFKDAQGHTHQINILLDNFPLVINDGDEEWLTNTFEFLHDNQASDEVLEALKRAFTTQLPQAVGLGFTIRLLLEMRGNL